MANNMSLKKVQNIVSTLNHWVNNKVFKRSIKKLNNLINPSRNLKTESF